MDTKTLKLNPLTANGFAMLLKNSTYFSEKLFSGLMNIHKKWFLLYKKNYTQGQEMVVSK